MPAETDSPVWAQLNGCSQFLLPAHRDLTLKRHRFRVAGIDVYRAGSVLSCFAEITTLKKDSTEQNVCINHLGRRIPEDCRLQGSDGSFLITTTLIDSTTK